MLTDGHLVASSVLAIYVLIEELGAYNSVANSTYNQSVAAKLLLDALGGNCKTGYLIGFDPQLTSRESVMSLNLLDNIRLLRLYPLVMTDEVVILQQRQRELFMNHTQVIQNQQEDEQRYKDLLERLNGSIKSSADIKQQVTDLQKEILKEKKMNMDIELQYSKLMDQHQSLKLQVSEFHLDGRSNHITQGE